MEAANFLAGGILLFFGVILRLFNASNLIAGYNTMPREEKAKIDEKKLSRFVGNMLILAAAVLIAAGLLLVFTPMPAWLGVLSWVLFFTVILGGVVYMNTGDRFRK